MKFRKQHPLLSHVLTWLLFFCLFFAISAFAKDTPTLNIYLLGIDEKIAREIRSDITLQHLPSESILNPCVLEYYIDKAKTEIALSLQAYGYYQPTIRSEESIDNDRQDITFQIEKGPIVTVESIDIQIEGAGLTHPTLKQLPSFMPIKIGTPLLHEPYEEAKEKMLNHAVYEGFLEAEFSTHRVEVDIQNSTAKIILILDTGPMYYFGDTTFSGSLLNKNLLSRFLPYQSTDPFIAQKLIVLEDALYKSDYFHEVKVTSAPNRHTHIVPIQVQVMDQKPNHYLFGLGYGTDTGVRGKTGYLRRRVNPQGHRFHTEIQLSEIYSKIEADYVIPGKRPQTDAYKIYTHYVEDEYNQKPVDNIEITISEKRDLFGWERTTGLSFIHEKSVTFSTFATRKDDLLLPFIEIKKTVGDNPNNPSRGKTRIMRLKGAYSELGSSVSFAQLYFQERWLHTFENNFKLLFRLEMGATVPRSGDKLPLSQRFFAGGDNSIRGFNYRSLPAEINKDDITQPVGGSYLFVSSIEIGKIIHDPFGVHIFTDAGNAFRNSADNIQVGMGAGISYKTRLGPIKFSIAKPLTNAAKSWRIHASFGPEL